MDLLDPIFKSEFLATRRQHRAFHVLDTSNENHYFSKQVKLVFHILRALPQSELQKNWQALVLGEFSLSQYNHKMLPPRLVGIISLLIKVFLSFLNSWRRMGIVELKRKQNLTID